MSSPIPGSCFSAVSVWNRPTGRPAWPTSALAGRIEDRRQALEAARRRRQPVRQRGELAGIEREQAVADEIDPVERVPGVLAELGLGEAGGLELADEQVAIDRLRRSTGRSSPRTRRASARRRPAARPGPRRSGRATGRRGRARRSRRERRVESEELGQEGLEAAGEVGASAGFYGRARRGGAAHPSLAPDAAPLPFDVAPRHSRTPPANGASTDE